MAEHMHALRHLLLQKTFGSVQGAYMSSAAGAATYLLYNRAGHPHVEASKGLRKDSLAEERDSMEAEGHAIKESSGRKLSRYRHPNSYSA